MYLIASSRQDNAGFVKKTYPELWRQVRRYNLPVQLSLAAAHEVIKNAENPETAALFSLAPCRVGSSDLYKWINSSSNSLKTGFVGNLRINPIYTLHVIDNLALSAFAMMQNNRAYCLGLGGAPGQAWAGIETVYERFLTSSDNEILLMAGDQARVDTGEGALGAALLFSKQPKPYLPINHPLRVLAVRRQRMDENVTVKPHSAEGLSEFIKSINNNIDGKIKYVVSPEHGDGRDMITIEMEIYGGSRRQAEGNEDLRLKRGVGRHLN